MNSNSISQSEVIKIIVGFPIMFLKYSFEDEIELSDNNDEQIFLEGIHSGSNFYVDDQDDIKLEKSNPHINSKMNSFNRATEFSITIPDNEFINKFSKAKPKSVKNKHTQENKINKFKAKEVPPSTFLNLFEQIQMKETLKSQKKSAMSI